MSTATWVILLGGLGAGAWWLFGRKDYFVQLSGGRHEYFSDSDAALDYAQKHRGTAYEIPAGSEFDERTARKLARFTPNRSRRRKTRRRGGS